MTTLGPPVINYGTTASYERVWRDVGLGGTRRVAFYRPIAPDGCFILGDYAQGDHDAPTTPSMTVTVDPASDDPAAPVLAAPVGFERIWTERGSDNVHKVSLWVPQPPANYVALGVIANPGHDVPDAPQLRCVRLEFLQRADFGPLIWRDHDSTSPYPISIYAIVGVTTFHAQNNDQPPVGPVYAPNQP